MKAEVAEALQSASGRLAEARAIQAAGFVTLAAALLIEQIATALAHTSETD